MVRTEHPMQKTRIFFAFRDHLGSTSTIVDQASGELVEAITYGAYGDTESDYKSEKWRGYREKQRFTGNQDEREVGLIYFGARYYSPLFMRWLSPDPMSVHAMAGDLNPYTYVSGQTFRATDPFGLLPPAAGKTGDPGSMRPKFAFAPGVPVWYASNDAGTWEGWAEEIVVRGVRPVDPPPPERPSAALTRMMMRVDGVFSRSPGLQTTRDVLVVHQPSIDG